MASIKTIGQPKPKPTVTPKAGGPADWAKAAAEGAPQGGTSDKTVSGIPTGTKIVVSNTIDPTTGKPATQSTQFPEGSQNTYWYTLTPDQRVALKSRLYKLGAYPDTHMVSTSTVPTPADFDALKLAMQYAEAKGATVDAAVNDPGFVGYIAETKKYKASAAGGDKVYTTLTNKDAAAAELTDQFRLVFNTDPTSKQATDYAKALNALESSRAKTRVSSTGQVITQTGLSAAEREDLMMQHTQMAANQMFAEAKKTGRSDADALEKIAKGQLGSTITQLRNAYASNGIPMPSVQSLYKTAVSSLYDKNVLDSNVNLIRQQASMYFPAIKEQIAQGYNVKDLLAPYINTYSRTLEKPAETLNLQDLSKVASDPTGKLMPLRDYQISLRKLPNGAVNPDWAVTQDAHDTFANVASTILKTWGLAR